MASGSSSTTANARLRRLSAQCPLARLRATSGAPVPVQPTTPEIRHGIYTAVTETGRATFKISHQAEDADFAPGRDILGVMPGWDNTLYTSIGFVNAGHVSLWRRYSTGGYWWSEALAQLIADPDAALESLKCRRCNRDLTTPESLAIGIGPECAKMVGL